MKQKYFVKKQGYLVVESLPFLLVLSRLTKGHFKLSVMTSVAV